MSPHHHRLANIIDTVLGTTVPLIGVIASWQEHLLWVGQMASVIIGGAVGVASFINLRRRAKETPDDDEDE